VVKSPTEVVTKIRRKEQHGHADVVRESPKRECVSVTIDRSEKRKCSLKETRTAVGRRYHERNSVRLVKALGKSRRWREWRRRSPRLKTRGEIRKRGKNRVKGWRKLLQDRSRGKKRGERIGTRKRSAKKKKIKTEVRKYCVQGKKDP